MDVDAFLAPPGRDYEADKALADGSADHMIKELGGRMAKAVKGKFIKALEAKKNKDKSEGRGPRVC